jgi:hypothetical protein
MPSVNRREQPTEDRHGTPSPPLRGRVGEGDPAVAWNAVVAFEYVALWVADGTGGERGPPPDLPVRGEEKKESACLG